MREPASGGAGTREANEQNLGLATGSEDEDVTARTFKSEWHNNQSALCLVS